MDQRKLLGSVFVACAVHGTMPPALVIPPFHTHRPTHSSWYLCAPSNRGGEGEGGGGGGGANMVGLKTACNFTGCASTGKP